MNTRITVFSILFASLVGLITIACNSKTEGITKISVDKDITVAIYSTSENGGVLDTISPCLLEEKVHISELLHYLDDEGVTMPFSISDITRYEEITGNNLDKRIAIAINGQVVSTPVVKMKIENGACSVMLDEEQTKDLFPDINTKDLLSVNN